MFSVLVLPSLAVCDSTEVFRADWGLLYDGVLLNNTENIEYAIVVMFCVQVWQALLVLYSILFMVACSLYITTMQWPSHSPALDAVIKCVSSLSVSLYE